MADCGKEKRGCAHGFLRLSYSFRVSEVALWRFKGASFYLQIVEQE